MHVDCSVYLGPYAACRSPMVPEAMEIRTCVNPECSNYTRREHVGWQFCGLCGRPIGDCAVMEPTSVILRGDVAEDLKDALVGLNDQDQDPDDGRHLWGINLPFWECRTIWFHPTDEILILPIDAVRLDREIATFQSQFSPQLDVLRRHYGPEHVAIEWGLVCDAG